MRLQLPAPGAPWRAASRCKSGSSEARATLKPISRDGFGYIVTIGHDGHVNQVSQRSANAWPVGRYSELLCWMAIAAWARIFKGYVNLVRLVDFCQWRQRHCPCSHARRAISLDLVKRIKRPALSLFVSTPACSSLWASSVCCCPATAVAKSSLYASLTNLAASCWALPDGIGIFFTDEGCTTGVTVEPQSVSSGFRRCRGATGGSCGGGGMGASGRFSPVASGKRSPGESAIRVRVETSRPKLQY